MRLKNGNTPIASVVTAWSKLPLTRRWSGKSRARSGNGGQPQVDDLPAGAGERKFHRGNCHAGPENPQSWRSPATRKSFGIQRVRARRQRLGLLASSRASSPPCCLRNSKPSSEDDRKGGGSFLCLWLRLLGACHEKPTKFVVFLTDDLGWETCLLRAPKPASRQAHKQGRFSQSYSACGVCSPPALRSSQQDALPQRRLALDTGRTPSPPPKQRDHFGRAPEGEGLRDLPCRKMALNGKFNSKDHRNPTPTASTTGWPPRTTPRPTTQPAQLRTQREGSAEAAIPHRWWWRKASAAEGETRSRETLLPQRLDPRTPSSDRVRSKFMELYKEFEDDGIRQHHGNAINRSRFRQAHESLDELGVR